MWASITSVLVGISSPNFSRRRGELWSTYKKVLPYKRKYWSTLSARSLKGDAIPYATWLYDTVFGIICQVALLREVFRIAKLTFYSDLWRRAVSPSHVWLCHALLVFLTFGLKLPNHAHFWGVLIPWTMFFVIETPKRHILVWIRVVWCVDRVYPSPVFAVGDDKEKRKGKGRKGTQSHKWVIFHLFGELTPLDRSPPKLACL